jgi:PTS system nitrogen regulatory IIA component
MKIMNALASEAVNENLLSKDRDGVLRELASLIISPENKEKLDQLVSVLITREELGSTGIGGGVAIPHGKSKEIKGIKIAFGRSRGGIDFNSIDGEPVDLFFLLLAPENSAGEHLKTLAKVSRLLKSPSFCQSLRNAKSRQETVDIIAAEDEQV